MGLSAYQTSHQLLREALRDALVDAVESAYRDERLGSVPCRAGAALELLLAAHWVDRRGRCRSCRRPGWLGRKRRICMIYEQAHFWLHQPAEVVLRHLAKELGVLPPPPPPEAADPQATDVLPRTGTELSPTPAASPSPEDFPRVWRSDPDHGGAGAYPSDPRSRRGPLDDPQPGPEALVLVEEGALCPA